MHRKIGEKDLFRFLSCFFLGVFFFIHIFTRFSMFFIHINTRFSPRATHSAEGCPGRCAARCVQPAVQPTVQPIQPPRANSLHSGCALDPRVLGEIRWRTTLPSFYRRGHPVFLVLRRCGKAGVFRAARARPAMRMRCGKSRAFCAWCRSSPTRARTCRMHGLRRGPNDYFLWGRVRSSM